MYVVARLVGRCRRLVMYVNVVALLMLVVGSMGLAPAAAAPGEASSEATTQVALTGFVDKLNVVDRGRETFISGWACAPDLPDRTLRIDVYNVADDFRFLGSLRAGNEREAAVAARCGGNAFKGFSGTIGGVCPGGRKIVPMNIRAFAVFSDSPPVTTLLPGARATVSPPFPGYFCPRPW